MKQEVKDTNVIKGGNTFGKGYKAEQKKQMKYE